MNQLKTQDNPAQQKTQDMPMIQPKTEQPQPNENSTGLDTDKSETIDTKFYANISELDDVIAPNKRNKCRWVVVNNEKIDQTWSILDILDNKPPLNWIDFFDEVRETELSIKDDAINADVCFPNKSKLFGAFTYSVPENIKLVMIGMDPYPDYTSYGEPRANGLCFAVDKRDVIPRSLHNIYTELKNSFKNFTYPEHGDLTYWNLQGVLMLNYSLTVVNGKPGSHSKKCMWEGFLIELIRYLDNLHPQGIVYVLFGANAKRLKRHISDRNKVVESAHPVARDPKLFFGHETFLKINKHLHNLGHRPVDWNVY